MRKRDVLDPNDPYWPRVRRLHIYLWAHGTLAARNTYVVFWSLLWLIFSIFGGIFSLVWRCAFLLVLLVVIDRVRPGMVSCVFRETIGYESALFLLSYCTDFDIPELRLISIAILILLVLILVYPVRIFLTRMIDIIFILLNIVAFGYPLKFLAYLASQEPIVAGKWFGKSYVLGPISTAMTDIFPPEYKHNLDHLWDVYRQSQSPAREQALEGLLEKLEARYFY